MTDQIPAGLTREEAQTVREWAERARGAEVQDETVLHAARVLLAVLPERPTLADMTDDERAGCQWMQADIIGGDEPLVITRIDQTYWSALILDRNGRYDEVPAKHVTPRPDLPRMTWPGDQKPAPVPALPEGWRLADHPDHGRVIVTTPTPDDDGDVYFAFPFDGLTGYDWDACRPDELTYLDGPGTPPSAEPSPEVHPGVTVGEPVTDPQVMLGISIDAPDGTIVVGHTPDCHPKATVKSGSTWQSTAGMRAHLYHALGVPDCSELESLTVIRWGKEADQ